MTFADQIELFAEGEEIEAIVIESGYSHTFRNSEEKRPLWRHLSGEILTWKEARAVLNYEYDADYGGQDCHNVTIWTKTRVFFIAFYHGATSKASVRRSCKKSN